MPGRESNKRKHQHERQGPWPGLPSPMFLGVVERERHSRLLRTAPPAAACFFFINVVPRFVYHIKIILDIGKISKKGAFAFDFSF